MALVLLPLPLGRWAGGGTYTVTLSIRRIFLFACFACLDSSCQLPSPDDSVQGSHPRSAALLSDTARVLSAGLLPWVQKLQTRPDRGRMHYCISRPPPHSSLRLVGRDAEEEDTSCLCWFHTNLGSLGHGLET